MSNQSKRRKDGKQKREAKRIQHANTYKEGFDHGFQLGLQVAEQMRLKKEKQEVWRY